MEDELLRMARHTMAKALDQRFVVGDDPQKL